MGTVAIDNSIIDRSSLLEHTMDGQQVSVKLEAQTQEEQTSVLSDEDLYEDAGDLDYTGSTQALILTRIPRFLWESWTQLGDDDEIQIGTIRYEGNPEDPKRVSLILDSNTLKSQNVPLEYNMHLMNRDTVNTYIFTEQDLPGYSSKSGANPKAGGQAEALANSRTFPRPPFQNRPGQGSYRVDKNKKWQPYFRKAIPKNTALAGKIKMELNCLPVENAEYRRIMDRRAKQALKPKRETKLLTGVISSHGGNLLAPGTLGAAGSFDTFIKYTNPTRSKPQESKAARIPQNELLDRIYDCFKRYTYWPLKSLKAELNQPEAYLKQTLELVAHLVRQGPHAMTWQLKPESRLGLEAAAAGGRQGFDGSNDDGDGGGGIGGDGGFGGGVAAPDVPDVDIGGGIGFDGVDDVDIDNKEFEDGFLSDEELDGEGDLEPIQ